MGRKMDRGEGIIIGTPQNWVLGILLQECHPEARMMMIINKFSLELRMLGFMVFGLSLDKGIEVEARIMEALDYAYDVRTRCQAQINVEPLSVIK
nr:hypothetical protein [Tanacetum cinerariifolium]